MREYIPIFALMIPIIALLTVPLRQWIRVKEKQAERTGELTAEKTAQYAAHTERLEQRVRVLERIITDKGMGVADEIEALRDRPAIERSPAEPRDRSPN